MLETATYFTKKTLESLTLAAKACPQKLESPRESVASTSTTRRERTTLVIQQANSNDDLKKAETNIQLTNSPILASTGVNSNSAASTSKPKRTRAKKKMLHADMKTKDVEVHPRKNKTNRVDSSARLSAVINSNSESICVTCNECLISANHDNCVVEFANMLRMNKLSKYAVNDVVQMWKPTGRVFTDVGFKWVPTGRRFTLAGKILSKTKNNPSSANSLKATWSPTGRLLTLDGSIALRSKNSAPKANTMNNKRRTRSKNTKSVNTVDTVPCSIETAIVSSNPPEPILKWGSQVSNTPSSSRFQCRLFRSSCGTWIRDAPGI